MQASPYVAAPYPLAPSAESLLQLRSDELQQLSRDGRPEYYVRRRVLGFVALGAGAFTLGVSAMYGFFSCAGESPGCTVSDAGAAGLIAATGLGLAALGTGIWAVVSAKHDNLHYDRIVELREEVRFLQQQAKEERRQRRYSVSPDFAMTGHAGVLRVTFAY